MSDDVLSDEQRRAAYGLHDDEPNGLGDRLARVERAVVAALAARSEVDVEVLAGCLYNAPIKGEHGSGVWWNGAFDVIADALRLALATAEARHARIVADYERRLAQSTNERERDLYTRFVCEVNRAAALEVERDQLRQREARHAERERLWRAFAALASQRTMMHHDDTRRLAELRAALGLA